MPLYNPDMSAAEREQIRPEEKLDKPSALWLAFLARNYSHGVAHYVMPDIWSFDGDASQVVETIIRKITLPLGNLAEKQLNDHKVPTLRFKHEFDKHRLEITPALQGQATVKIIETLRGQPVPTPPGNNDSLNELTDQIALILKQIGQEQQQPISFEGSIKKLEQLKRAIIFHGPNDLLNDGTIDQRCIITVKSSGS
jgi:hypothetical protein